MDITPIVPKHRKLITSYGGGGFKVNQEFFSGSIMIIAGDVLSWAAHANPSLVELQPILERAGEIEILLLGTGVSMLLPDAALRQAFKAKNISLDAMDTGAACRTYNVLLGEERRVALAAIAV